jgi:ubiquinone biosynthesis accessory factor UbiJ
MVMTLLTAAMEQGLRRYLALDPQTLEQLGEFAGKVIEIDFINWNKKLYLFPEQQGLRLQNYYEGSVDVCVKGTPLTLMRVGLISSEQLSALGKDIEITGDVTLIQKFMQIFQQMQIDWEEILSLVAGDTVAHQLGNVYRGIKQWGKQTMSNLTNQLVEYLQEAHYLPPQEEVEDFFAQIQTLQNDVARLEARIKEI